MTTLTTRYSPRVVWTLVAGLAGVGLLGAVAVASSGAPTLPSPANSHARSAVSSHSPDDSDSDSNSDGNSDSDSDSDSPEPDESGSPSATPVGPDATGPAAFGLCTAYEHASRHGKSAGHSIAFRNLANAAGGVDQISAYCANIIGSGHGSHGDVPSHSHPAGRPSTVPSHGHH